MDPQGCCEVIVTERAHPGGQFCGRPAMMRYPAMGGGWMHLCDEHGAKHAAIIDLFGQRWTGAEWALSAKTADARIAELETAVSQLRTSLRNLVDTARPAFRGTPYRAALDAARELLETKHSEGASCSDATLGEWS